MCLYCRYSKSGAGSNWAAMESQWHLLSIATKFILAYNLVREPQGFKLEEMSHIVILIVLLWTDTYVRLQL